MSKRPDDLEAVIDGFYKDQKRRLKNFRYKSWDDYKSPERAYRKHGVKWEKGEATIYRMFNAGKNQINQPNDISN